MNKQQLRVEVVPIDPPPEEQRVTRQADFVRSDEKKDRYHLPNTLESGSPVGYRTRVSLSREEADQFVSMLNLERPAGFRVSPKTPTERELFEECALGVVTSRQSTNYRGHKQVTLNGADAQKLAVLLKRLRGLDGEVLDHASHAHVVLTKPYRTPFTLLLTFIGHKPIQSLLTVPIRALRKKFQHIDDIPTIGFLQHIHLGVLADAMERAAIIASNGQRCANVLMSPFCGTPEKKNRAVLKEICDLVGVTQAERTAGWRVGLVAQVGENTEETEFAKIPTESFRKFGANLMAFRSERIQPGVNQDDKAPPQYRDRQDMDVPEALTVQSGRAAYNAFVHWTGCTREKSKELLLLERIDVLTPNGKHRIRAVRDMLGFVTERVLETIPLWADIPTGKALSRNAARGKKAFALAGQRIYVGGLDRGDIEKNGIDWELAVRAFGAAAARSALVAEIMGVTELPDDCDLLAGICLMAGPVNQNDMGKSFYGQEDMLKFAFEDKDPTALLVWTLKAKTIADPIGNEEQLLNTQRKGALVDLRPAPHEVVTVKVGRTFVPLRNANGKTNRERAFSDLENFVTSPDGKPIPGNVGETWSGENPLEQR